MFTGIVELTVPLAAASEIPGGRRLELPCPWPEAKCGQSVAVNGCCLTIAELDRGRMHMEAVAETLARTNLGRLQPGEAVHLERALRLSDRLDGHLVQGHIDSTAALLARQTSDKECRLTIQTPPELAKYIVPKGSVALDGVSLTIAAVRRGEFEVALIPTTLDLTALGRREIGWPLNLEADMVVKTIVYWMERRGSGSC